MSFLKDWWDEQREDERALRERDPGFPAYPWLPDGSWVYLTPTQEMPVSFWAIARERLLPLFNLDQLRRSTHSALAGRPDTRTAQQMSRDAWAAYVARRDAEDKKHEGTKAPPSADRSGDGQVQEAGGEAQGEAPGRG